MKAPLEDRSKYEKLQANRFEISSDDSGDEIGELNNTHQHLNFATFHVWEGAWWCCLSTKLVGEELLSSVTLKGGFFCQLLFMILENLDACFFYQYFSFYLISYLLFLKING